MIFNQFIFNLEMSRLSLLRLDYKCFFFFFPFFGTICNTLSDALIGSWITSLVH